MTFGRREGWMVLAGVGVFACIGVFSSITLKATKFESLEREGHMASKPTQSPNWQELMTTPWDEKPEEERERLRAWRERSELLSAEMRGFLDENPDLVRESANIANSRTSNDGVQGVKASEKIFDKIFEAYLESDRPSDFDEDVMRAELKIALIFKRREQEED